MVNLWLINGEYLLLMVNNGQYLWLMVNNGSLMVNNR